ncbi:MAG: hypothetical protein ABSB96_06050 [Gaiellaceae bacterium]
MSEERYLLYVWTPGGYALEEREGELPAVGSELNVGETRLRVSKIAASPLPNDPRPCAYLQPA